MENDKRILEVEEPLRRCVNRLTAMRMPLIRAQDVWHGLEIPADYLESVGEIVQEVLDDLEITQQNLGLIED